MSNTETFLIAAAVAGLGAYGLQRLAAQRFADAIADGDDDRAEVVAGGAFELALVGPALAVLLLAGAAISYRGAAAASAA